MVNGLGFHGRLCEVAERTKLTDSHGRGDVPWKQRVKPVAVRWSAGLELFAFSWQICICSRRMGGATLECGEKLNECTHNRADNRRGSCNDDQHDWNQHRRHGREVIVA